MRTLVSRSPKIAVSCAILCGTSIASCQNPAASTSGISGLSEPSYIPHLAFDVASIREAREGNMSYIDNPPQSSFYHAERALAWGLILNAYDIKIASLLKGVPNWAMTIRYNVTAKSESATDDALTKLSDSDFLVEKHHMLRGLLTDRFRLQIHPETRVAATYELVATARMTDLMTPVQGEVARTVSTCDRHYSRKGVEVESKGCPFPILLSTLRQELGSEVIDHSGLSGMYAYHLMWAPADMPIRDGEDRFPSIRDAVREQLGLELKQTKGPVTFWVVDHIERPTQN